jgi:hypothetical protein
MVMVVMAVVVPMMRRIRQRDVCEKNQCDREADNLTHARSSTFVDECPRAFESVGRRRIG